MDPLGIVIIIMQHAGAQAALESNIDSIKAVQAGKLLGVGGLGVRVWGFRVWGFRGSGFRV